LTQPDAKAQSDRQLVEAALRDKRAYANIVTRYKYNLSRYVSRLLGRRIQAAEDVLQDIFIKAYVNLNDYDTSRPFSPWIYRIAHNEAISHLRKGNAEPPMVTGDDAQLMLDRMAGDDNPAAHWQERRTTGEIQRALGKLDSRYRDVIVLRFLEEKSYDEIADILQLPPGTVATCISRGLKQLKVPLQESWDSLRTGAIND
jgi:RNA polymerase sigma-70 factor, ECF subfamily